MLHPLSLTPKASNPFWYATREVHHIFIDDSLAATHSLVHEIIHAILMEEGYHFIRGHFHSRVHPIMTNDFTHPEVFRRMACYGVDMATYFNRWPGELRHTLDEIGRDSIDLHAPYVHFARVYPWHFFRDVSAPFLTEFHSLHRQLADAIQVAVEATRSIGFQTTATQRQCLEIFKYHWLRFSESHLPVSQSSTNIVDAIRKSRIVPLSQRHDEIDEARIYEYLSAYGLMRDSRPAPRI